MRQKKVAYVCVLIFLAFGIGLSEASWMLEGQVWSSPYQEGAIYLSQLSVKLEPHKHLDFTASLPVQYSHNPELQEAQCLYPRFSLAYLGPVDDVRSVILRADYQLKPQRLGLQGGIHMLYDPLAVNLAISYHERTIALEGSVVFAVNERWALGAHLHYSRNSLLTYELYHTSKKGKQRQIRYSYYLDGSMQCLGLKITL